MDMLIVPLAKMSKTAVRSASAFIYKEQQLRTVRSFNRLIVINSENCQYSGLQVLIITDCLPSCRNKSFYQVCHMRSKYYDSQKYEGQNYDPSPR